MWQEKKAWAFDFDVLLIFLPPNLCFLFLFFKNKCCFDPQQTFNSFQKWKFYPCFNGLGPEPYLEKRTFLWILWKTSSPQSQATLLSKAMKFIALVKCTINFHMERGFLDCCKLAWSPFNKNGICPSVPANVPPSGQMFVTTFSSCHRIPLLTLQCAAFISIWLQSVPVLMKFSNMN